jgi:hypothetical protein
VQDLTTIANDFDMELEIFNLNGENVISHNPISI